MAFPIPPTRLLALVALAITLVVTTPTAAAGPLDDCKDYEIQDLGSVAGLCVNKDPPRPQDVIQNCITLVPDASEVIELIESNIDLP